MIKQQQLFLKDSLPSFIVHWINIFIYLNNNSLYGNLLIIMPNRSMKFMTRTLRVGTAALAVWCISSCSAPKDIVYFQDITENGSAAAVQPKAITVRPNDKISIMVNSRDPQLSDMFNLPYVSRQLGQASRGSTYGNNQGLSGYTVNEEGNIDFPILGTLHVAGMTRHEIAAMIKSELISKDLVKDPVVTVEFLNLAVSVIGEVNRPGRYAIERDNMSVMDALSAAGDLTINGVRTNVKVLRTENGKQNTYLLDLTSADSLRKSPAYYLQQDDIVVIEPNDTRKRQSTVNGNNVRSTSFWISLASLATSVAVLIKK